MENMLQNIDLIHRYLSVSIIDQFCLNVDLEGEYIFTQNIISKKIIIATTFTDQILSHPQLKLFLSALIAEINSGRCTVDLLRQRMRHFEEMRQQPVRRII
ncbi:hypothetical protein SAMN05421639_10925 [Chryseobacterium shigense]|uniref:Uncharacterized protein n=1 Tax=Chryseobacterium shigense TaxID=297244 RepID=A0A1N7K9V7_9FLAO|nr:hypothetical protein [Chryseobacterium shigense]SIS58359.1 hypothetical protein SAMN05421639_10925 [Chryseobacterium shigense]